MNKKQLQYVCAYADVYSIKTVKDAIEASNVKNEKEDYIDLFLEYYHSMLDFDMKFEVQTSMEVYGIDFIPACNEWDL